MHKKISVICILLIAILSCIAMSGCGASTGTSEAVASAGSPSQGGRETCTSIYKPKASGDETYGTDGVSIDASNKANGYIMVKYTGKSEKVKMQLTAPDKETVFTYTIKDNKYQTFPISAGDGKYTIDVLENTSGDMYALLYSTELDVKLKDEYKPFLYPNQYVWYTADSDAIDLAIQVSDKSKSDLDYVGQVYSYVITHIKYDTDKAENVSKGYIPDIDDTLASGKGICFDYASLMTAMLRCQQVPTKLVVGYSGQAYHAWISVYLEEQGWVDDIIEFDGKEWKLMDPTLASSNDKKAVQKYVGDGSNYTVKYFY